MPGTVFSVLSVCVLYLFLDESKMKATCRSGGLPRAQLWTPLHLGQGAAPGQRRLSIRSSSDHRQGRPDSCTVEAQLCACGHCTVMGTGVMLYFPCYVHWTVPGCAVAKESVKA